MDADKLLEKFRKAGFAPVLKFSMLDHEPYYCIQMQFSYLSYRPNANCWEMYDEKTGRYGHMDQKMQERFSRILDKRIAELAR